MYKLKPNDSVDGAPRAPSDPSHLERLIAYLEDALGISSPGGEPSAPRKGKHGRRLRKAERAG